MEDIIYTKEEIIAYIDILKSKLNINFIVSEVPLELFDINIQYLECVRKITFITNNIIILSKNNIIDELNNAKNIYLNMEVGNHYTIEGIDEFINILNS